MEYTIFSSLPRNLEKLEHNRSWRTKCHAEEVTRNISTENDFVLIFAAIVRQQIATKRTPTSLAIRETASFRILMLEGLA